MMVVGVNGVGKTTTIAKLARYWSSEGRNVLLAAADTFRAAAIDQLKVWGERVGLPVVAHQPGADPGSVVYDSITAARARGADLVIVDTAGRLHTKFNLMEEMKKIERVAEKLKPAYITNLLVLDATTGQNALIQAKQFQEAVRDGRRGRGEAGRHGEGWHGVRDRRSARSAHQLHRHGREDRRHLTEFDPGRFVDSLLRPLEAEGEQ